MIKYIKHLFVTVMGSYAKTPLFFDLLGTFILSTALPAMKQEINPSLLGIVYLFQGLFTLISAALFAMSIFLIGVSMFIGWLAYVKSIKDTDVEQSLSKLGLFLCYSPTPSKYFSRSYVINLGRGSDWVYFNSFSEISEFTESVTYKMLLDINSNIEVKLKNFSSSDIYLCDNKISFDVELILDYRYKDNSELFKVLELFKTCKICSTDIVNIPVTYDLHVTDLIYNSVQYTVVYSKFSSDSDILMAVDKSTNRLVSSDNELIQNLSSKLNLFY